MLRNHTRKKERKKEILKTVYKSDLVFKEETGCIRERDR